MTPNLPVLAVHDGRPMADSREVAATFGKQHKHVLEAIRDCHCSADFRRSHFRPFKIKDLTGESTSHVLLDRSGFAFVILGFTGAAAGVFREAYIDAFDRMEEELRKVVQVAPPAIPQSLPEALRLAADLAEANAKQAAEIAVLEPRSRALATIADGEGSFCIRDCAKMLGLGERTLIDFLVTDGWIYRRSSMDPWIARHERRSVHWMTTKVHAIEAGGSKPWNRPQARITCAGLVVLAKRLGKPIPPEAQANLFLPAPARA